jgi:hypothetical protein
LFQRLVFDGRDDGLIEKVESIVISTGTGSLSFLPASNRHCFTALTAASSRP